MTANEYTCTRPLFVILTRLSLTRFLTIREVVACDNFTPNEICFSVTLPQESMYRNTRSSIPAEETDAVEAFITAKRIEGCSEKTLSYYRKTIEALIAGVGKAVQQITTDDLRRYLTNYQVQRRSSKVAHQEYSGHFNSIARRSYTEENRRYSFFS